MGSRAQTELLLHQIILTIPNALFCLFCIEVTGWQSYCRTLNDFKVQKVGWCEQGAKKDDEISVKFKCQPSASASNLIRSIGNHQNNFAFSFEGCRLVIDFVHSLLINISHSKVFSSEII